MSDLPAFGQPGTRMKKKTNDARTSPVPEKGEVVRHILDRYLTETIDAGTPMPALGVLMSTPSYA
jgi:hypothetical protein